MKFRDKVLQANSDLVHVPAGFKRYGHVMVLRSSHQLSSDLGHTILSLYSWCKTVYQHLTTTGQSRIPELVLLAGQDQPEVIHKENGTTYVLDIKRITFSGGNRHLRERLVEKIANGETLVDMFAAVGNLSLQPLVHRDIEAILVERNPYTFSYLRKSLKKNRLSPEIAHNTDCRALRLTDWADRIFMGYHNVDQSHLEVAVQVANPLATLHLHPIVPVGQPGDAIDRYQTILDGLDVECRNFTTIPVKDYAPGLEHIEVIIEISS